MSTNPRVTLRYFAARGRAQAIREFLCDQAIAHQDEQVPMEGNPKPWPAIKTDPSLAGPFRALPVLHWGDALIAETLPIAAFLDRNLEPCRGLDDVSLSRLEAVCSASFMDVVIPVSEVIWSSLAFPGCEPETAVRLHGARAMAKLAQIDALYPGGRFLGGERPALADFFVAEALDALAYILPPARHPRERFHGLAALERRLAERAEARGVRAARPARLTGCPIEPEVVDRLRKVDWTG